MAAAVFLSSRVPTVHLPIGEKKADSLPHEGSLEGRRMVMTGGSGPLGHALPRRLPSSAGRLVSSVSASRAT